MVSDRRTTSLPSDRHGRFHMSKAVAMAVTIVAALLFLPACQRQPVMRHATFVHLPASGWQQSLPVAFSPQYDDSTRHYGITLAVRHSNGYAFSNLSLVVDVIAADSTVNRSRVEMTLADDYGNWTGGGFGSLYQNTVPVVSGVAPTQARSVVVWQAMEGCDTLACVTDLGIIVTPIGE